MLAQAVLATRTISACRAQHLLRRAYRTRMAEQWRLSAPHATLPVSLPESACFPVLCVPHAFYTRLIGRWDCQPRTRRWKPFCQRTNALLFSARRTNYLRVPCAASPAEGIPHPIGGTVKPVSPSRGIASHFAREHMLAHSLLSGSAFYP